MANGHVSWDEWRDLTDDQREYSLYMTLKAIHECHNKLASRIEKLESRKWFNSAIQFGGALLGGAIAVIGYIKMIEPVVK